MAQAGPTEIPSDFTDSDDDMDCPEKLSPRLEAQKKYLDSLSPKMSPRQTAAQRTPSVSPSPEPRYAGRDRSPSPILLQDGPNAAQRKAQRTPSVSPSPEARMANKRQRTPSVSPSPEPRYAGRERSPSPEVIGVGKAAAKRLRAERHDREEAVRLSPKHHRSLPLPLLISPIF